MPAVRLLQGDCIVEGGLNPAYRVVTLKLQHLLLLFQRFKRNFILLVIVLPDDIHSRAKSNGHFVQELLVRGFDVLIKQVGLCIAKLVSCPK